MDTSNYMKSEPNQVNTTVSYTNNMQEESLLDEESHNFDDEEIRRFFISGEDKSHKYL